MTLQQPAANEAIMPASYVRQLVTLVTRWQVSEAALLDGTGIAAETLSNTRACISPKQYAEAVHRARILTGEPALAIWWGQQMRLSWHGAMGFAVLSSGTLQDALYVAVRYLPVRVPQMAMAWQRRASTTDVLISESFTSPIVREYSLIALFVFLSRTVEELCGKLPDAHAELAIPEPDWFSDWATTLPLPVHFDAPGNRICFPSKLLDNPLQSGDPAAWQQALDQCEQEMASLSRRRGLGGRARQIMLDWSSGVPSREELAEALAISPRSLARRLSGENTSYRLLVDDVRCQRACHLLSAPAASVEQVAEILGYSDAANFTRAFRRWSGVSPRAWRKQHAARDC